MKMIDVTDTRWFYPQIIRLFKSQDSDTYAGLGDAGGEESER